MFGNRKVYKGITRKCGEKYDFSTYNSTEMIIIGEEMNDTIKSVTDSEVQRIKMIIVKRIIEINSEHIANMNKMNNKKIVKTNLYLIKKAWK